MITRKLRPKVAAKENHKPNAMHQTTNLMAGTSKIYLAKRRTGHHTIHVIPRS